MNKQAMRDLKRRGVIMHSPRPSPRSTRTTSIGLSSKEKLGLASPFVVGIALIIWALLT